MATVAVLLMPLSFPASSAVFAGTTTATASLGAASNFLAGSLYSVGFNSRGQAGQGPAANQSTPTQVGSATVWSSARTGDSHSCSPQSTGAGNGTVWCWGSNTYGQLGQGDNVERLTPTQVGSATDWNGVASGRDFACSVKATTSATPSIAWCWGRNNHGQLGIGNTTDQNSPQQVGSATWSSVSPGVDHACGIQTDGTLWCWGSNGSGQLGLGNTTEFTSPQKVGSDTHWAGVSAGNAATCARNSNAGSNTLWCWGLNSSGQLGLGDTTNRTSPTQVGSATTWVSSPTMGTAHVCARQSTGSGNGTIWCSGDNTYGQLGIGNTTSQTSMTQVGALTTWTGTVSSGSNHVCGRKGDGTVWCWGRNNDGQVGDGTTTQRTSPVQVGSSTLWTSTGLNFDQTCGVQTNGASKTLWCWGDNSNGELGIGPTSYVTTLTQIGSTTTWATPTAGGLHGCATQTDGTLWCWGGNSYGQLGTGDTLDRSSPTQIGAVTTWASVSAGGDHTCAVRTGGTLWCWGRNNHGQLGKGDTTDRSSVTQIGALTTWATVAAGYEFTCATKTDHTIWCWGRNASGQVGNNSTTDATSPVQENGGATNWSSVTAGNQHACGVRSDGTLYCWGDNQRGSVGINNTTSPQKVPVRESTSATTWSAVSAGTDHTCAIKTAGTLFCWGENSNGQLGIGTTTPTTTNAPTQVGASTSWKTVTTGQGFTCGTQLNRVLWCWGDASAYQLGQGDTTAHNTPTQVTAMIGRPISTGSEANHVLVIK